MLELTVNDGEDAASDQVEVNCAVQKEGDLDGDGEIDRDDVYIIKACLNQSADVCPECDIDGDGTITVLDARKLMLMCTCPRCICD